MRAGSVVDGQGNAVGAGWRMAEAIATAVVGTI